MILESYQKLNQLKIRIHYKAIFFTEQHNKDEPYRL